jgi:hypothetical protein
MPGSILVVDKKTEFGLFRCEERIKDPQFRKGVDYNFDGSIYFILSPRLRKDIMLIQNPYNDNVDVSDLEVRVLVDRKEEINIKPRIVSDLEKREGLIDSKRGIPEIAPSSRFQVIEDKESKNAIGIAGSSNGGQPGNSRQNNPHLTSDGNAIVDGEKYDLEKNFKLDDDQVELVRQQNNYHSEI